MTDQESNEWTTYGPRKQAIILTICAWRVDNYAEAARNQQWNQEAAEELIK